MERVSDQRLDDVAGEELAARQEQRRDDILTDLLNGSRWDDLVDYIYDFQPDWLNQVLLKQERYKLTVLKIICIEEPSFLSDLAEKIAAKEAERSGRQKQR